MAVKSAQLHETDAIVTTIRPIQDAREMIDCERGRISFIRLTQVKLVYHGAYQIQNGFEVDI